MHAFLHGIRTAGSILYAFFACAGTPGGASFMHFYVCRRPWGSIFYAFLPVPAPLGQHLLCIFTCAGAPGAASSMHFYLCRRPWGSIFYAFLPVPAPLGQHPLCIFICAGAPCSIYCTGVDTSSWVDTLVPLLVRSLQIARQAVKSPQANQSPSYSVNQSTR